MNGQMRKFNYSKYNEQLRTMPEPVMSCNLPKVKLNLTGVREYARNKGVSIASLSDDEKRFFMKRLD